MHKKFCSVFRSDSFAYHLVVTYDSTSLKHTAKNCLLAHKVRLNFSNERRFKNTGLASAHTNSQSLCISPALAFRVVYRVNGDKVRNTETSLEFVPNFCARTFRSAHNNSNVVTNLHSFFNHVKTVAVPKGRTLFHSLHNFGNNGSVLLVRGKVTNQVGSRNKFVVSTYFKAVFSGIFP